MGRSTWMYTGDIQHDMSYELRPGVEQDRYARPDESVWRYLPLARFLDAMQTGTLFFTRLSYYALHGDPFEGSTPLWFDQIRENVLRERGDDITEYNREARNFMLQMLQTVLVNCWHKREYESEPMWRTYGHGEDAVAIVSTLDRLIDSMPENVTVGHVDYVDFAAEESYFANLRARAFMKRRTLEEEREVRAVLYEPPITEGGRWSITIAPGEEIGHVVQVDLSTLVTGVVLSPNFSGQRELVSEALAQAGIAVPILDSEVDERPRY